MTTTIETIMGCNIGFTDNLVEAKQQCKDEFGDDYTVIPFYINDKKEDADAEIRE